MSNTPHTILVTGSSRGIGKAIALCLAEAGYNIVLHSRSQMAEAEAVKEQIQSIGRTARILQFDVADRAACKQSLENDVDEHGAYYGVVCNAGIIRDGAFPALTGEEWDDVIHTNLDAFYNVLHPLVMPMVRRRKPGRIVTLASVSGLMGNRGQTNYSAAKAGIIAASKSLALELGKRQITVNTVAPGFIETAMTAAIPLLTRMFGRRLNSLSQGGLPVDVAEAIAFFGNPLSRGVNGNTLRVCGQSWFGA